MKALRSLAAIVAVLVAAGAGAAPLPLVPRDMPYPVARRLLINLGYVPSEVAKPKCAAGREDVCDGYTEIEACLNDSQKRCSFLWKSKEMTFEVQTRGETELVVDRIRCRAKCDEPARR